MRGSEQGRRLPHSPLHSQRPATLVKERRAMLHLIFLISQHHTFLSLSSFLKWQGLIQWWGTLTLKAHTQGITCCGIIDGLISWNLRFFVCKIGLVIVSISWGRWDNEMCKHGDDNKAHSTYLPRSKPCNVQGALTVQCVCIMYVYIHTCSFLICIKHIHTLLLYTIYLHYRVLAIFIILLFDRAANKMCNKICEIP